ncbi:hypothetical protein WJX74_008528 [Apatococcus lobatus]|uniref:Uncharacterized protein n=1 Tax=Apatococcus lobatus TaxID=904363 RepID=A0AAW1QTT0_9CHLO
MRRARQQGNVTVRGRNGPLNVGVGDAGVRGFREALEAPLQDVDRAIVKLDREFPESGQGVRLTLRHGLDALEACGLSIARARLNFSAGLNPATAACIELDGEGRIEGKPVTAEIDLCFSYQLTESFSSAASSTSPQPSSSMRTRVRACMAAVLHCVRPDTRRSPDRYVPAHEPITAPHTVQVPGFVQIKIAPPA